MSTDEYFQFLQIKKYELKVNIHCDGCKKKVKKILKKIEGVYSVDVDAEKQKVKVYGNVDFTTLINKLLKSGKYAEIWPTDDQEIPNFINDENDQKQIQNMIRSFQDQKPFERYSHMGWDDHRSLMGEDGSGLIDLEGSQLDGGSCNGGLQTYHDHISSMPIMNMYKQSYPAIPMVMNNMNMVHDNMSMHQPWMLNPIYPMSYHAHCPCYY